MAPASGPAVYRETADHCENRPPPFEPEVARYRNRPLFPDRSQMLFLETKLRDEAHPNVHAQPSINNRAAIDPIARSNPLPFGWQFRFPDRFATRHSIDACPAPLLDHN